ncbi:MAG TPA: DUF3109 family protein [Bacteroidota bacterium]|nr:DUF3109 family protein [Bacteroidota bacterium]
MRVDRKIFTTRFACDLVACKGACCTFPGGSGPPIRDEEKPVLERAYRLLHERLPMPHQDLVRREGLFELDEGEWTIRCYDERACVFVVYEDGIARCAIQRAYDAEEFPWPKPVSCHLFPIRIKGKTRDQLRYERFGECDPALERGEELRLPMVDFLEEPLTRALGRDAWLALKRESDRHHAERGG